MRRNDAEMEFFKIMNILAEMCNHVLDEDELERYDLSLQAYGYDRVNIALKAIIRSRKSNDRFPTLESIQNNIQAPFDNKSYAMLCANRILWAFNHWGMKFTNMENFQHEFIEKIGDLEWRAVESMGGYKALYKEWCDCKEISFLRSQIRDTVQGIMSLIKNDGYQLEQVPLKLESK